MNEGLLHALQYDTVEEFCKTLHVGVKLRSKIRTACYAGQLECVQWLRDNTPADEFLHALNDHKWIGSAIDLVPRSNPTALAIYRILLRAGASPNEPLKRLIEMYTPDDTVQAQLRLFIDYGARVQASALSTSVNIDTLIYASDYEASVKHALFAAYAMRTWGQRVGLSRDMCSYAARWIWRLRNE